MKKSLEYNYRHDKRHLNAGAKKAEMIKNKGSRSSREWEFFTIRRKT